MRQESPDVDAVPETHQLLVTCLMRRKHVYLVQASTQGLVKELQSRGEAEGSRILCPVPLVTGGLTEPQVVPRFLASLQVSSSAVAILSLLLSVRRLPLDVR